jgi:hypothetical protein
MEWSVLLLGSWVVLGVTFAGITFVYKVVEMLRTIPRGDVAGFAVIQVITYLMISIGFFCLFLWSFVKGDFRDLERAKYLVLEMEQRAVEQEERSWNKR